ncbi:MAG: DUF2231 domain-containing protein [Verrucomicrobia bacterium]|nr:DUF2231 domain-containing protein [Verrucomicrobiota bacterium]MBV9656721.1 DUF2231 domain-containing protein [Verrucomicrobiota bacterium]
MFGGDEMWTRLHGATTHFPIALLLTATALETLALLPHRAAQRWQREWRAVSRWLLGIGAVSALPVVFSGLALSRWNAGGQGLLWKHHLFVWPSFGLLIALAIWRIAVGESASRRSVIIYFLMLLVAAGCVAAAGFWGGELAASHG